MKKTDRKFSNYVCGGDSIEIEENGFTFVATIHLDECSHIDDDDSHNIDQTVTGCNGEQQEKLLAARNAWNNAEWFYCGITLAVYKGDILLEKNVASLWSIEANYPESDNSHLSEVVEELIEEVVYDKCEDLLEKAKVTLNA